MKLTYLLLKIDYLLLLNVKGNFLLYVLTGHGTIIRTGITCKKIPL